MVREYAAKRYPICQLSLKSKLLRKLTSTKYVYFDDDNTEDILTMFPNGICTCGTRINSFERYDSLGVFYLKDNKAEVKLAYDFNSLK